MFNFEISLNLLIQIIFATIILFFIIIYFYYKNIYDHWKRHGIASPKPTFFIGHTYSFSKPEPLMQIEYQEKYGDIYGIFRGLTPTLVVSDPKIIKRILVQDFHLFRNRIKPENSSNIASLNLASSCDDNWKRIRSILTPMFTASKLRKMENLMSQCIDSLLNAIDNLSLSNNSNKSFFVHGVMGNYTMDVIAKCAFATDTNAHSDNENQFVKNAKAAFNINVVVGLSRLLLPPFLLDFLSKIRASLFRSGNNRFFTDLSRYLIKQRRENSQQKFNDMLQLMIKAEHNAQKTMDEDDKFDSHHVNIGEEEKNYEDRLLSNIIGSKYLSEDEIVAQCLVFFLAGYETTASTLTFCLYELAKNSHIQDKLYDEIRTVLDNNEKLDYEHVMRLPYLDACISETLRLHSPATALQRIASAESYHIPECNYTMKKNEGIRIPIYAIHHNPKYFSNPMKFDPERFMPENRDKIIPYTYLPFGGGPRNCIGMRFALSEAKLGLSKMISKFKFIPTKDTVAKLKVRKSFLLLKTDPIYIGVQRR